MYITYSIRQYSQNDVRGTVFGLKLGFIEMPQEIPKGFVAFLFKVKVGGNSLFGVLIVQELLNKCLPYLVSLFLD